MGTVTPMLTDKCNSDPWHESPLLVLRFEIPEAARILRMSRAQLYNRIGEGSIRPQKDGARTYISRAELERYVEACDSNDELGPKETVVSQATLARPLVHFSRVEGYAGKRR